MRREFLYLITEENAGQMVKTFLRAHGYSKHLIISLKQAPEYLTINGTMVYVRHILKAGEVLRVVLPPEPQDNEILPSDMPLSIVYEDDDILVINKDAGVPIHPSHGHQEHTLANGLVHYFAEKKEPFVFRVINRLDRDTTGLLIVARHALSACALADMVRNHRIHRTYLAAVQGNLFHAFPEGSGTIDAPIGRAEGSIMERQVDFGHGEAAVTHVKVLSYDPSMDTSLACIRLETGRTHQIRVHMKYIGFPLHGDFLYHPDYRYIGRQSLHSWKLEFCHPVTGMSLHFEAPVPKDMQIFDRFGCTKTKAGD